MKKLLILSIISVFTLSSFATFPSKENKEPVKLKTWFYTCADGRKGSFLCDGCDHSSALIIANTICQ